MSTVFVREKIKEREAELPRLCSKCQLQAIKKEVKWCFFFHFYDIRRKKNDSDYKHTLFTKSSNSGSLRWCESSVWSPSLGNFSNPSTPQKNKKNKTHWCQGRGGKKGFCRSLITDYYNPMNKHLSCQLLHYEAGPRDCGAIWNLLPCYIFMSSTNFSPSDGPSNVRKAAQRASWGPPGLKHAHFLMHHLGFVKSQPRKTSACRPQPATRCQEIDWSEAKAELTPQLARR